MPHSTFAAGTGNGTGTTDRSFTESAGTTTATQTETVETAETSVGDDGSFTRRGEESRTRPSGTKVSDTPLDRSATDATTGPVSDPEPTPTDAQVADTESFTESAGTGAVSVSEGAPRSQRSAAEYYREIQREEAQDRLTQTTRRGFNRFRPNAEMTTREQARFEARRDAEVRPETTTGLARGPFRETAVETYVEANRETLRERGAEAIERDLQETTGEDVTVNPENVSLDATETGVQVSLSQERLEEIYGQESDPFEDFGEFAGDFSDTASDLFPSGPGTGATVATLAAAGVAAPEPVTTGTGALILGGIAAAGAIGAATQRSEIEVPDQFGDFTRSEIETPTRFDYRPTGELAVPDLFDQSQTGELAVPDLFDGTRDTGEIEVPDQFGGDGLGEIPGIETAVSIGEQRGRVEGERDRIGTDQFRRDRGASREELEEIFDTGGEVTIGEQNQELDPEFYRDYEQFRFPGSEEATEPETTEDTLLEQLGLTETGPTFEFSNALGEAGVQDPQVPPIAEQDTETEVIPGVETEVGVGMDVAQTPATATDTVLDQALAQETMFEYPYEATPMFANPPQYAYPPAYEYEYPTENPPGEGYGTGIGSPSRGDLEPDTEDRRDEFLPFSVAEQRATIDFVNPLTGEVIETTPGL